MQSYKIYINDRKYNSWTVCEMSNFQNVSVDINPIVCKLFSNDVFVFVFQENKNENEKHNNIKIIHSTIRTTSTIPGVLILDDNKTYGRQKTTNNDKKGRLLYKCIPDDMRLPPFLIPYELKHVGFSKKMVNLYVTFQFTSWEEKHPYGMLSQVIGPVDILDNFYEYQLYCKSLNTSIQKFQKDAKNALENTLKTENTDANENAKECKNKTHNEFIQNIKQKYPCIEDRTNQKAWHIFTIDPPKSIDYDDGYSVRHVDNGTNDTYVLSIYISNVTIWMDVLNLWESFSRRIATIYLPDRKRPMLPTILSDCLCSLIEKQTRIALVMDITIQNDIIIDIKYSNCMIKVIKNYKYEEHDLLNDKKYIELFNITKTISKKYKYLSNVKTSHDVVGYLMILMNYHCAKNMLQFKNGVFRSTIMKREIDVPSSVPDDVSKHIKLWNSACGQYINGVEIDDSSFRHELLDMDAYIHITSPIRRLVDLMNIIKFQQNTNIIQLSENANMFYDKWINDIDYINVTMRSIRKVQCDCSLLDMCHKKPDILENTYDGYMYDKIIRNDGLYQYIVYLPSIKMSSRITLRESINNYDKRQFKLFLFNDEESFKKKIRLQLLET